LQYHSALHWLQHLFEEHGFWQCPQNLPSVVSAVPERTPVFVTGCSAPDAACAFFNFAAARFSAFRVFWSEGTLPAGSLISLTSKPHVSSTLTRQLNHGVVVLVRQTRAHIAWLAFSYKSSKSKPGGADPIFPLFEDAARQREAMMHEG
jgi:hypothetical protein